MPIVYHPSDLGAQRFFARVRSFDLECPSCGCVHRIRTKPTGHPQRLPRSVWEPYQSRFTCRECRRPYLVGLLAWPTQLGGDTSHAGQHRHRKTIPDDQRPDVRQRAEIRALAGGYWMSDKYRQPKQPGISNIAGGERPEPDDDDEKDERK